MAKKILIADDDEDLLKIVQTRLTQVGYDVKAVVGGKAALEAVEAQKPDLIVCDLQMPDIQGFEVSAKLKSDARFKDIPMILLSGLVGEDSEAEGLQEGDFYMAKPVQFDRLIAKIKEFLKEA